MFEARSHKPQTQTASFVPAERLRSGAAEEGSVRSTDLARAERLGHRLETLAVPGGTVAIQRTESERSAPRNRLPPALRARFERLSGLPLGDVRVHRNSPQPGQIEAHAFTRGTEIHLAPGQDHQLPHEAWHAVQQKRGRVAATGRLGGLPINADPGLEREADAPAPRSGLAASGVGPAESVTVLQARWIKVEGSGDPGSYYWEGRGEPSGTPPNGGNHVLPPPPQQMEDTHKGGGGGSMKSLRTRSDYPEQNFDLLVHEGSQAYQEKGRYYTGPTESRGLGRHSVSTTIPTREKGLHTKIFGQMTGGEKSSTKYQESLGTSEPSTKYNILHGMGHGEGGSKTQDPRNLASASEGSNTLMIPYDKSISGNPDVSVDTSFTMRKGTERAEMIHQKFFHKDLPDEPIHEMDFDGDQPKPTVSQYEEHERRASRYKDRSSLQGAVDLINFSRTPRRSSSSSSHLYHPYQKSPAKKRQSAWGRLGQFAPGSHPLDQQPKKDGDGIL